jgi:hypothetical protein
MQCMTIVLIDLHGGDSEHYDMRPIALPVSSTLYLQHFITLLLHGTLAGRKRKEQSHLALFCIP